MDDADHTIKCNVFDFRKHIAFDTSQMELPVKCEMCNQHATHFCMIHRGVYCVNHVPNHKGISLEQFVMSQDSSELIKKIWYSKGWYSYFF